VDREVGFHIEMRVQELVESGWDPVAARAEAARLFGDVNEVSEECRDLERRYRRSVRRARVVDGLLQDARFGLRTLRKTPVFTAMAVVTLALGIGASTAIFSVVRSVLMRPLPYPNADELVLLWEVSESGRQVHVSTPNFRDWRERGRTLEGLAAHPSSAFWGRETVLGGTEAARVRIASVTRDFFPVLGVQPVLGRALNEEDHRFGAQPVVVVSYGFWERWLGGDRDLAARPLQISGQSVPVVGVMPRGFDYPAGADVWAAAELFDDRSERSAHNWRVIGRLRDGVTLAAAREEFAAIGTRLKAEYGEANDAATVDVVSLRDDLIGSARRPLWLLLGASGLVLLIACTNLAGALLARGSGRQAEVAVRTSLGASRARIVAQLLNESFLLSLAGAVAGLALGAVMIRALAALAPAGVPRVDEVRLDGGAVCFALAASVMTALLFGLYPAMRASRLAVGDALRAAGRGNSGMSRTGWWGALVGGQVALAVVLLVGSGLLIRSFLRVTSVDPGFRAENVLTADISLPESEYATDAGVAGFLRTVLGELARVSGVESVGVINHLPMGGFSINGSLDVEGGAPEGGYAAYRIASADYFESLDIPVVAGRTFEDTDDAGTPDVVIVNQAAAKELWPGVNPLGKRIRNLANDRHVYGDRWLTVIGVVGDVRHTRLTSPPVPEVYVHFMQRPARIRGGVVTMRTSVPPARVAGAVRDAMRRLDADVPVELGVMDDRIARTVADRQFTMLVLALFAGFALLLASVGIYSVVAYAVARRTHEIGIRLALGLHPRRVQWLVQRRTMAVVVAGAAAGIVGALALTGLLANLLFEVSPTDALTFACVAWVLLCVAWLASYLPARRTMRVDPMVVLRSE
jgi:predicted permease